MTFLDEFDWNAEKAAFFNNGKKKDSEVKCINGSCTFPGIKNKTETHKFSKIN